MKINYEMMITIVLSLVVVILLNKFVLDKIGGESESYDAEGNYMGEEYA